MRETASTSATPEARRGFELQGHYIGGRFVASIDGATFESLDPATNEPLAEIAAGQAADVEAAVTAARQALTRARGRG